MKTTLRIISLLVVTLLCTAVNGQTSSPATWTKIAENSIPSSGTRYILPEAYQTFKLNIATLEQQLAVVTRRDNPAYVPVVIDIPRADGSIGHYLVQVNTVMAPELAAKFQEIRAFDGKATDGSGETVKLDWTPQGFHAMILAPGKPAVYVDPYSFGGGDREHYVVYSRDRYTAAKWLSCQVESLTEADDHGHEVSEKSFGSCELRTYRLALSATGEYTAFHGGTLSNALAAQVTTMNRVNGIYERDMAITLVIIANNDLIVYTNAATDPFTNGDTGSMYTQNQSNTTAVIGSANYDIGHVFGTDSGGLAGLGVVCSNNGKARGVTGSSAPVGDPFDIDYVAHEMGHQFGANHTQNNNCNRNGATAVETGSGSTIMGYAGICPPDVQPHSDDHFHGRSLQEIGTFITGGSHTCPVKTPLTNTAPSITGTLGNYTIPANTPFALTAVATDPEDDSLTYCWEQMDNQVATQPPTATATTGPSFRSFSPTPNPTRYLPNLDALTSNGPFTWERLSTAGRTMKFRCVVRDNATGGGCNDHEDVTITTTSTSGPFLVTYPNASGIHWAGGSTKTVTWDVANTTLAPVACDLVDVMISLDAGQTFTVLADNVANDGSQVITVPNTASVQVILMVMCANGTFFDVSDNLLTIDVGGCIPPDLPTVTGATSYCVGDSTLLTISATSSLNDATTWTWYKNTCGGTLMGTGNSMYIAQSGFYYVRGEGGCTTAFTCRTLNINQNNVNTIVNTISGVMTAQLNGAIYQWIDCATNMPIDGATNRTFSPTVNGSYAVIVTAPTNGCTDTSTCLPYNQVGLTESATLNASLYPNPTTGTITLSFAQPMAIQSLTVTDATGRKVLVKENLTTDSLQLDLSRESKGIYFITIESGMIRETMKITKN